MSLQEYCCHGTAINGELDPPCLLCEVDSLEQQNAELVAALELCKKHMAGDKWDSLFIDGVLSKVKQP